ncbi:MAG TPA: hypothetical protein VG125_05000 [Pirellulales bacterium]|jgi:hypothetical protein|nr:hypothetical protein [Pirellulales bacterium]
MSTTNSVPTGEMQQLIDQRLDAIDRALLGLLPRQDRLSIVTQVESRLRELAAAGPAVDARQLGPAQDPLLADAAHLETAGESPLLASGGRRLRPLKLSRLALSSGVLGIVALALLVALPITYLVVGYIGLFEEAAEVLLGAQMVAVALGGTLAVALSIVGLVSLRGSAGQMAGHGWAITGLSTGPLPMFVGGLIVLVVGLELLAAKGRNMAPVTATSASVTIPAPSYPPPYTASLPSDAMGYAPATNASVPMTCPSPVYPTAATGVMVEAPLEPPSPVEQAVLPQPSGDTPHVAELPPLSVD